MRTEVAVAARASVAAKLLEEVVLLISALLTTGIFGFLGYLLWEYTKYFLVSAAGGNALGYQPGNIGIYAVVGHTAHGGLHLSGLIPVTGGEGQVQLLGGKAGIFVEHFVEVAQAEKQHAILVLGFDFVVLPLHRGQFSHNITP